jgi:hypothetical protein
MGRIDPSAHARAVRTRVHSRASTHAHDSARASRVFVRLDYTRVGVGVDVRSSRGR